MGKQGKAQQRPKDVKGPSSSGNAVDSLIGRGASMNAFDKFRMGGQSSNQEDVKTSAAFEAISDTQLRSHFKHLSKKDPTTRIKALQVITQEINNRPPNEIISVLADWVVVLKKLVLDNHKRVRESSFIAHKEVVTIVGKELGPYLKQVMPCWMLCMCEHDKDVSDIATKAFHAAFSQEKRQPALQFALKEMVTYASENLKQTVQTLSDPKTTTKTDAEDRYERIISSSLQVLERLASTLPKECSTEEKFTETVGSHNLYKLASIKQFATIRASMYSLIGSLSENTPDLLEPHLNALSPVMLGCFGEKDIMVHERMIGALVSFLKQYPSAWKHVNAWKAVFPRLFAFLRNSDTSAPSRTYQTLVPFLSLLDMQVLGQPSDVSRFMDEFFSNFWLGYLNPRCPPHERSHVISNYFECVMFVLLQPTKYVSNESDQATLFQQQFTERILHLLTHPRAVSISEWKLSACKVICKFSDRPAIRPQMQTFWNQLLEFSKDGLRSTKEQLIERELDFARREQKREDWSQRAVQALQLQQQQAQKEQEQEQQQQQQDQQPSKKQNANQSKKNVVNPIANGSKQDQQSISNISKESPQQLFSDPNVVRDIDSFIYRLTELLTGIHSTKPDINQDENFKHFFTALFIDSLQESVNSGNLHFIKMTAYMVRIYPMKEVSFPSDPFESLILPLFKKQSSEPLVAEITGSYLESYPEQFENVYGQLQSIAHDISALKALLQRTFQKSEISHFFKSEKLDRHLLQLWSGAIQIDQDSNLNPLNDLIDLFDLVGTQRNVLQPSTIRIIVQDSLDILDAHPTFSICIPLLRLIGSVSRILTDSSLLNKIGVTVFMLRVHGDGQVEYLSDRYVEQCIDVQNMNPVIKSSQKIKNQSPDTPTVVEEVDKMMDDKQEQEEEEDDGYKSDDDEEESEEDDEQEDDDEEEEGDDEHEESNTKTKHKKHKKIVEETPSSSSDESDSEEPLDDAQIEDWSVQSLLSSSETECRKSSPLCNAAWDAFNEMYKYLPTTFGELAGAELTKLLVDSITNASVLTGHRRLLSQVYTLCNDFGQPIQNILFNDALWNLVNQKVDSSLKQIVLGHETYLIPNDPNVAIELSYAFAQLVNLVAESQIVVTTSTCTNYEWMLWMVIRAQRIFSHAFRYNTLTRLTRFVQLQFTKLSSPEWIKSMYDYISTKDSKDALAFIKQYTSWVRSKHASDEHFESQLYQSFNMMALYKLEGESIENVMQHADHIWKVTQAFGMNGNVEFVKGVLRSQVGSHILESIMNISAQCISLLMESSSQPEITNLDQDVKLMKLSATMAVLMILMKRNFESDAIDPPGIVRSIRNLESSLFDRMDSEQIDTYLNQLDHIACRVTHAMSKSEELDVKQEDDSNFVDYVRRFMIRATSSLNNQVDQSNVSLQLLQNSYYLIASCKAFFNPSKVGSETLHSLNVTLLEHFMTLVNLVDNVNYPKTYPIFSECLSQVSTTLRITCTSQDYVRIHDSEEGIVKDHMKLLSVLTKNDLPPVTLLCAHDLLCGLPVVLFLEKRLPRKPITLDAQSVQDDDVVQYNFVPMFTGLIAKVPARAHNAVTRGLHSRDIRNLLDRDDHRDVLSYLLSWSLLCDWHVNCKDDFQRASIVDRVKDNMRYAGIFGVSFSYQVHLPESIDANIVGSMKLVHAHHHVYNKNLDSEGIPPPHKPTEHELDIAPFVSRHYICQVASHVFIRVSEALPVFVRLWFRHCQDARASSLVEEFVTKQVSPAVIQKEMSNIDQQAKLASKQGTNLNVKVVAKRGQVNALYEQDEVQLDLSIQVPDSYPLKPPKVTSSRRLGLSEAQWRKWMLRMTTVLFQKEEGSTLWDTLQTWKSNLDRHFEGAEPCPICYSIVHAHDHSLPKITCRTCKSRYHGGCLYKWFSTSGSNSCPTCRSVSSFVNSSSAMPSQK